MLTLYGPLEEGLARLAGRHAVMKPRGEVSAHQTRPLRPRGALRGQVVPPQEGVHLQRTGAPESGFSDPRSVC